MPSTPIDQRLRPMPRRFYRRDAVELAQRLLGRLLIHDHPDGRTAGIIVETEAYAQTDPASHSCIGPTERNRVMFGPAGILYVYRSYGMHWCANVVAGEEGFGAAVLLRALEPIRGIEVMLARRKVHASPRNLRDLARGPGRLCKAMGITSEHYGADLTGPPLWIATPPDFTEPLFKSTGRIGISKAVEVPWRFCVAGSPFVSGPKSMR